MKAEEKIKLPSLAIPNKDKPKYIKAYEKFVKESNKYFAQIMKMSGEDEDTPLYASVYWGDLLFLVNDFRKSLLAMEEDVNNAVFDRLAEQYKGLHEMNLWKRSSVQTANRGDGFYFEYDFNDWRVCVMFTIKSDDPKINLWTIPSETEPRPVILDKYRDYYRSFFHGDRDPTTKEGCKVSASIANLSYQFLQLISQLETFSYEHSLTK